MAHEEEDLYLMAATQGWSEGEEEGLEGEAQPQDQTDAPTAAPTAAPTMLAIPRLSVLDWLQGLHMQHHLPCFQHHHVDELALPLLTDTDLTAMGIQCPMERSAMLTSIPTLCDFMPAPLLDQLRALAALSSCTSLPGVQPCSRTPPSVASRHAPRQAVITRVCAADGSVLNSTTLRSSVIQSRQSSAAGLAPVSTPATTALQAPPIPLPSYSGGEQAQFGFARGTLNADARTGCDPSRTAAACPCPVSSTAPADLPFNHMFRTDPPPPTRITSYFPAVHPPESTSLTLDNPLDNPPSTTPHVHPTHPSFGHHHQMTTRPPVHQEHQQSRSEWPGQAGPSVQQRPATVDQQRKPAASSPRLAAPASEPCPAALNKKRRVAIQGGPIGVVQVSAAAPTVAAPGLVGLMMRGVPPWHTLPGTRFTVDYFNPAAAAKVQGSNGFWILTHFHADHYKGLSRTFAKGKVLCSQVTADLVNTRLKAGDGVGAAAVLRSQVPVSNLHVLPMNETKVVDGVLLTLVDANHCPGAVMVIAHPPNKPPVLHTGDCRLSIEMQQQPALQALRGRGTTLVLDTTYCNPQPAASDRITRGRTACVSAWLQYVFPRQQETLEYTLAAVKAEMFNPRVLFVFGTYTIGKERLFLEVAHILNKKVYVSKDKLQVLQCCNLAPSYLNLLTNNHLETNFHAVPLHKVNLDGLSAILLNYKGRYNTVVGIQPTGWAMQRQSTKSSCGRRIQKGTIIMHSVPYSEHSSFKELHEFCTWLQPGCILPSVGNDSGAARDKMLGLLKAPLPTALQETPEALAATAAGSKPITAFFTRKSDAAAGTKN